MPLRLKAIGSSAGGAPSGRSANPAARRRESPAPRRRQSSWARYGPLFLVLAGLIGAIAPPARAEEFVTTPGGHQVALEHVIHPGGIVSDYWQYVDENGKEVLHGVYLRYYRNGERRELTTYAHGVKDGPFVRWRDHEVPEVEGQYVHGELDGLITWYFPSGKKRNEEFYRDGQLNGPYAWYDENGALREKGTYLDGERHGAYTEYHDNGRPSLVANYQHGFLSGELALYDEEGRMTAKGKVERDMIAGTWICYSPPGGAPRPRPDCRGKIYVECNCP